MKTEIKPGDKVRWAHNRASVGEVTSIAPSGMVFVTYPHSEGPATPGYFNPEELELADDNTPTIA